MGDLRAAAVETRRDMMGRISGWMWQGRVMKGELDEGRSGGEEKRRRETKGRPGWELLRRDKQTGKKEEGRSG